MATIFPFQSIISWIISMMYALNESHPPPRNESHSTCGVQQFPSTGLAVTCMHSVSGDFANKLSFHKIEQFGFKRCESLMRTITASKLDYYRRARLQSIAILLKSSVVFAQEIANSIAIISKEKYSSMIVSACPGTGNIAQYSF